MGNEIPRTETIEEDDDNGTKGGVKDTANDRGDDRDRYGANKYMEAILHPQSAKSCRGWWNPGVTIMRCFIHQHLPICVNVENITNYPPQSMAVASVLLRPSLATTPSLPWPSRMEGLSEVSHYTNGVKGKRNIGNTLSSHDLIQDKNYLHNCSNRLKKGETDKEADISDLYGSSRATMIPSAVSINENPRTFNQLAVIKTTKGIFAEENENYSASLSTVSEEGITKKAADISDLH